MDDVFQKSAASCEPRGRLDPEAFSAQVHFRTLSPPADLAPFIEHGWVIRWEDRLEPYHSQEVMHRPYVDAFVADDDSGVQGTFRGRRTYQATVGSGRVFGVRFWPGAFHALWPGRMADLLDGHLALDDAFPAGDAAFVERLRTLDDEAAVDGLFDLVRGMGPAADPKVGVLNDIIGLIERDAALTTVTEVAGQLGRSERWVQHLFHEYVGIGLKWLLLRRTLLVATARIRDEGSPDWADLAYELGYSSQQHFTTDFKRVMGKSPTQYQQEVGGDGS